MVQVIGEVVEYRNRNQLKVSSVRVLPAGTVDAARLLPSVGDVERYWTYLDRQRAEVEAPRLKAVLGLFFDDPDFRDRFQACPGSLEGRHAALGGLLQHTAEVAAIATAIARASGADQELVVAGALLHDIGKLEAYRWDGALEGTEILALEGHVVAGVLTLERTVRASTPPPCSERELAILTHLILAAGEQVSHVAPATLESVVLQQANLASERTASISEAGSGSDWGRESEERGAKSEEGV